MDLLTEDIVSFVENVALEEGIENCTIASVKTNEKGEGYLGQIFLITLKDTNGEKLLDIVVKSAFPDEEIRKRAPMRIAFLNEIYFYTELVPEITKLGLEHKLPPIDFLPKCYKAIPEISKEKLCLENIKALNFEVFGQDQILDDEHISFIFKVYGRFHAYTFALKEQKPKECGQIVDKLHNVLGEFLKYTNSVFRNQFVNLSIKIQELLVPGEDDDVIEKFEKYLNDGVIDQYNSTFQTDDYSTILHGDCWSNNMLFKYEEIGGEKKLVDMRLLDFQIIRVGSPVCDLSYCLYSGASKTVYDNLDLHLKNYHDSFSSTLKKLGNDPEKIYPFHVLKQHWKRYSPFGMLMGFAIIQMKAIQNKQDFTVDFDESKFPVLQIDEVMLKTRVKELLYHMAEIGAL